MYTSLLPLNASYECIGWYISVECSLIIQFVKLYKYKNCLCGQERPYHSDSTASRLLSEVKHCRARLVLRWGTTLESLVLFFYSYPFANIFVTSLLFYFYLLSSLIIFCFARLVILCSLILPLCGIGSFLSQR